jgi:ABC-type molybdate transport system permease subunit
LRAVVRSKENAPRAGRVACLFSSATASQGDLICRFVAALSLATWLPRERQKSAANISSCASAALTKPPAVNRLAILLASGTGLPRTMFVEMCLVDRRMMYFDNHKLKRNFQDSL